MQRASLLTRDDTFFGICEGLGGDFGIHPNFLRLAFAGLLFWNPVAAISAYATAGLVVALTRWLVPEPTAKAPLVVLSEAPVEAAHEEEPREPVALAA